MSDMIKHLLDRLPELQDKVEHALETNTGFEQVAREHHEVCDELSARGDGGDPGERERLEQRRKNLEEEIVRMLDSGGIV
jgi:hypothetical protein